MTRAARADLYGDAINHGLVVAPGGALVRGLVVVDDRAVDGVVEGGSGGIGALASVLRRAQNGYVRTYALSVLAGAVIVVLAMVAVTW
ncbi:hypothetical protein [Nocardioides zeae]